MRALPQSEEMVDVDAKKSRSRFLGPLPFSLAFKWTIVLAIFVAMGMGLLGTFLIAEQEAAFERQTARAGGMLADQLARASAEPLLADDRFALELLVRRELDDQLVLGAAVFDSEGWPQAVAGIKPEVDDELSLLLKNTAGRDWLLHEPDARSGVQASVFVRPIKFKEVIAGYALLSLDRGSLERDRRMLINAMIAATSGLIFVIGFAAFPLARWMSEPIRRLAEESGSNDSWAVQAGLEAKPADEVKHIRQNLRRQKAMTHVAEDALRRYVSPNVARTALAGPDGMSLQSRTLNGSVLFCDIVAFTRLSQELDSPELVELVNDYFGAFASAGTFFAGTVDKFIGDCVMILFGAPDPDDRHALNAISCGRAIVRLIEAITVNRRTTGRRTVAFRLAVNSGPMQAGNLGSLQRMELTVIGETVNLASRLGERSPLNELVISDLALEEPSVREHTNTRLLTPVLLKGYDDPVSAHIVDSMAPAYEAQIEDCLEAVIGLRTEPL